MRFFDNKNRSGKQTIEDEAVPGRVCQTVSVDDFSILPRLLDESAAFWFSQSEGDRVPDWARFSPNKHAKFLTHILLCEVIDAKFFVRIAGESVVAHFPAKIANQFLHEIDCPELTHLTAELNRVVDSEMPLYVDYPRAWAFADEFVGYRALHMPFRTEDRVPDRVLSVITFQTEPKIDL